MTPAISVLILLFATALSASADQPTSVPTTAPTARPVVAVTYEHSYPPPGVTETRRLIIAIYPDGLLRWSDNQQTGGAPYRTARVTPQRVMKLLDDLHTLGFFTDPDVDRHRASYGPDASYTVLAAERGEQRQRLASWHDPAPGGFVHVTEQGLIAVEPGQPAPQPSPSFKRFTDVWRDARRLTYDVLPTSDEPLDRGVFDVGRKRKTK